MGDKVKQWLYYFLIGIISLVSLMFLPMLGSELGLAWNLPNTVVGWIVFVATKLIVAILNVLIFYCFMQQAKVNVKDNENYVKAKEILSLNKVKDYIPKAPGIWVKKQYSNKGVTVFITTILSTFALTQAILTFDYVSMLTYLFTIITGLIFGIIQMKTAEEYWTTEFYDYALMIQKENTQTQSKESQVHITEEDYVNNIITINELKEQVTDDYS